MVAYGVFTSRREQNRQRYRSDKFYRGTFAILIIVLVAQLFVVAAAAALFVAEKRIQPETRAIESRRKQLASEEERYAPLLQKLRILTSLRPLIVNRMPSSRLINNIEEAFSANEQVSLVELKLYNHFDPNDPNGKDDFTILITGAIKLAGGNPTAVLTDFTKTLEEKLPKGANVGIARNAVVQGAEAFAPFEVRIHYGSK
jgi:flagellar basal body-associated protein FliL